VAPDEYGATLAHLYRLRRFGVRPGLEVIRALTGALGEPQHRFPSIHVAGSKGKGSVSALAAQILQSAGLRTGLFTSPHLQSYRERIQINREPIPVREVIEGVRRVRGAADALRTSGGLEREPTFFEITTAVAFDWFARERVDAAVVEVGLGGRLDATNVLRAPVAVITTIELEHTEVLGPTLEAIAREKAGILAPGMRAVVGEPKPEPLREIRRIASERGVPVWQLDREIRLVGRSLYEGGQRLSLETPHRSLRELDLPLLGNFQARNAGLAVGAAELFAKSGGCDLSDDAIRAGLAAARWRGRLERVARSPDLYLDAAHTPESARALAQSLVEILPFANPEDNVVVFGCLQGKRVEEMFEELSLLARTLVLAPIRSDRSLDVDELRRAGRQRFPRIVVARSAEEALRLARAATGPDGYTLAAGSDYLVGELLNALEGTPSPEPDLSDPTLRGPGRERPVAAPRRPTRR
jgi:dihydrofolate synthase/folylpolyglutamate synthase